MVMPKNYDYVQIYVGDKNQRKKKLKKSHEHDTKIKHKRIIVIKNII